MKIGVFFLLVLFTFHKNAYSQSFSGIWKGAIFNQKDTSNIDVIYLDLDIILGIVDGKMRIERYLESSSFILGNVNGKKELNKLTVNLKKKIENQNYEFKSFHSTLKYNDLSGYLTGILEEDSSLCLVLFKEEKKLLISDKNQISHHWVKQLLLDLTNHVSAPLVKKKELKNFKFETVFFDYDKFDIRSEHFQYLDKVVKMLQGHSDLRLKIIGHTDSDGSNNYNYTLSKNRAQSLVNYFQLKGIDKSRIIIDFRGEDEPVDTNSSKDGKQRNRRVDFEFI